MARMPLKPRLIFDRCVDFLVQNRIQVPSSRTLTDSVRVGLHERKAELIGLIDVHLSNESRRLLDDLLAAPEDTNRYRPTLLKKLSQSTKPTKIREAVSDFQGLSELYHPLGGILSKLDLGVAGIRYFAGSVLRSEIFQRQRRDQNDRYIHATAFVAHQFFRCQDNMIDRWLSVMATFKAAAVGNVKRAGAGSQRSTAQDCRPLTHIVGSYQQCLENTISQKKSSAIPSEFCPRKRPRKTLIKTGAPKSAKNQRDQINTRNPVVDLVPWLG